MSFRPPPPFPPVSIPRRSGSSSANCVPIALESKLHHVRSWLRLIIHTYTPVSHMRTMHDEVWEIDLVTGTHFPLHFARYYFFFILPSLTILVPVSSLFSSVDLKNSQQSTGYVRHRHLCRPIQAFGRGLARSRIRLLDLVVSRVDREGLSIYNGQFQRLLTIHLTSLYLISSSLALPSPPPPPSLSPIP